MDDFNDAVESVDGFPEEISGIGRTGEGLTYFRFEDAWTQHLIGLFHDLENLVQTQAWPFLDHPNARVTFLRLFMVA
jgi:hypothetical protein